MPWVKTDSLGLGLGAPSCNGLGAAAGPTQPGGAAVLGDWATRACYPQRLRNGNGNPPNFQVKQKVKLPG